MPTMEDAGVNNGTWHKPAELAAEGRIFEILDAIFRESNDPVYADQVVYTIRFLDEASDEETEEGDIIPDLFSLPINDVRQKHIDWFSAHPGEALNGVKQENGLMLFKGANAKKGNPPFMFRDATAADYEERNAAPQVPF